MTVKKQIEQDLKTAMLGRDQFRATLLRGLKSAILNAEIADGKRQDGLENEAVLRLLAKEAKLRQESADLYLRNGAEERGKNELAEKTIIEEYLPEQMSDDDLKKTIEHCAQISSVNSISDMGKLIGQVKAKVGGQADGARIAIYVKEYLNQ